MAAEGNRHRHRAGIQAWVRFDKGVFTLVPSEYRTRDWRRAWGPFLESPGNFTGPKSNIQIEI